MWYRFDAGFEPCPFLLHLLMQIVTIALHRAPVMNAARQQTTAVMAVTAAGDRFLSSEVRK